MNITTQGTIPDYPLPYDDTAIKKSITDLDTRLKKLETATPIPTPIPSTLYSSTSFWNAKLSPSAALNPNSASIISELNAKNLRVTNAWIACGQWSVPLYFSDVNTPRVKVNITNVGNQNTPVSAELAQGVRIPANAKSSEPFAGDHHLCVIDTVLDKEYDLWDAHKQLDGSWNAQAAGILPNVSTSNGALARYWYWNSARACHLPLGGGLILLKELRAGVIPHALAFAIPQGRSSWVSPASSSDGPSQSGFAIPQGMKLRFPADIVINSGWTPLTKMLVVACRDYGLVNVDTAGNFNFYVQDPASEGLTENDVLTPVLGGRNIWDIMGKATGDGEVPFSKLQVVA